MKKTFAQELAELINRHSIDAKLDCPDWVLANYVVSSLNAYGEANANKGKTTGRKRRVMEPGGFVPEADNDECDCPVCTLRRMLGNDEPVISKRPYKKPEAFDVPKEVQAMADFFGDMFPDTRVEIHRVEIPRRNPRDRRRGKNKRNNGKGGNK